MTQRSGNQLLNFLIEFNRDSICQELQAVDFLKASFLWFLKAWPLTKYLGMFVFVSLAEIYVW